MGEGEVFRLVREPGFSPDELGAGDVQGGTARSATAQSPSIPKATTEDLVAAYERAREPEKKLIRELMRAGKGKEAKVVSEILHYFPGSHLTK